jgi:hypothetical protein
MKNVLMQISESGAAFHVSSKQLGPIDPGPGMLEVHRSYWRSFLSNTAFYEKYPLFKLISK